MLECIVYASMKTPSLRMCGCRIEKTTLQTNKQKLTGATIQVHRVFSEVLLALGVLRLSKTCLF